MGCTSYEPVRQKYSYEYVRVVTSSLLSGISRATVFMLIDRCAYWTPPL